MMRRRAFFGGKKEPLYLFKEGVGFDSTKCSYVTNSASTVTVSSRYIDIHYNSRVEEGGVILIGDVGGSYVSAKKFSWSALGYKTLYVEGRKNGTSGISKCGLCSKTIASSPKASDWVLSRNPGSLREIVSYDLTGQPDSTIGIWGEVYDDDQYGHIYNIWLE